MRSSIDVHNHLLAADVAHELPQLSGTLDDLRSAPAVLGLPAAVVGRITVLERPDGAGVALVLAPADVEVDLAAVEELLGEPLAPAPPDQVAALTGYRRGLVPPVALEQPSIVIMDARLAQQDVIYTAAGEPGLILKIRAADLVAVTDAVVAPVGAGLPG